MTIENLKRANEETRETWNQNATFWNERMGEGNDFIEVLIWPATERLLDVQPGERVLDIACGNGLSAHRLAALGAEVVAFDFAEAMIAHALERTSQHKERISYLVLDATDETALLQLGESQFDAAICNMALFDMAEIEPLMRTLARLLRPGGRFVFSVIHPCFNSPHVAHVAEMEDRAGEIVTLYALKVFSYIQSFKTFKQDFSYHPEPGLEASVTALATWFAELDRELKAVIEGLSEEDITSRTIDRGGGFRPAPFIQLEIYKEVLLIFYGKVSVYLKAMGKSLPEQWQEWIG